ncbi:MAG: hypothetical protein Q9186_002293 [Xanthomendoza sp. 1 TL-2023]
MPTRDVIDLCLSTDDEVDDFRETHVVNTNAKTGGAVLAEQFLDIDENPRKKRKLSDSEREKIATLPVINRAHVHGTKSPLPTVDAHDSFLAIDDDPIVWTSSPKQKTKPLPKPSSNHRMFASLSDSDASLPDEAWLRAQLQKKVKQATNSKISSEKTKMDGMRPSWRDKNCGVLSAHPRTHFPEGEGHYSSSEKSINDNESKSKKARKPKLTDEEKASQAKRKEEAKAAAKAFKFQEKEELKERKRLLKEEQAREKQQDKDRAEANKLKLDKKLSTPEMIVDLPLSIEGSKVDTQIREVLKGIGVEITSYHNPVPNLIKWRRKVESRFNAATGAREKLQNKEIDTEKHLLCLMSANEFIQLATSSADENSPGLDEHVTQVRSALHECIPIYLVEGLDAWMRKNKNAKNRAYQAAVLGQSDAHVPDSSTTGSTAASRRRKPRVEIVDEDMIEDALLRLQVMNNCLVHHTAAPVETAEWIAHFTEQISQIPYRWAVSFRSVNYIKLTGLQARANGT